jgi:hypothetical protein
MHEEEGRQGVPTVGDLCSVAGGSVTGLARREACRQLHPATAAGWKRDASASRRRAQGQPLMLSHYNSEWLHSVHGGSKGQCLHNSVCRQHQGCRSPP